MHRLTTTAVLVLCAALISACGRSKAEKQAEETQKAAEQVSSGARDVAEGTQDLTKGLAEMAKGLEDLGAGKTAEPVSFRELQKVFPEIEGWQRGKPTGEKMSSPVSFSQSQVTYTNGDAQLEVKIVDSGLNQILLAPYAMFLTAGYEKETADGYEKSSKVGGYPGWERWDSGSKRGELNALVNKRFLMTIEGSGIDDTKVLYRFAEAADLKKLATLN